MGTLNDVMDYARFFHGKDEPPPFYRTSLDLNEKIFVPTDDAPLGFSLCENPKEKIILHYFEHDTKQNRLLRSNFADEALHQKVYAAASPDFSADSSNCFSCLNEANILKSRICAYRWQVEREERVILTLIWTSDAESYKWAFGNVEKGSIIAVSSQGVKDDEVFKNGFIRAIEKIEPENICWYGKIYDWADEYYDSAKIIKMQTRTQLVKHKRFFEKEKRQGDLFAARRNSVLQIKKA